MNSSAPLVKAGIFYTVAIPAPRSHLIEVELTIENAAENLRLSLPAWIPGSYMIRDFARHVVRLDGSSLGRSVVINQQDKQTWQVATSGGQLTIRYQVYAADLSVRGAHVDNTHVYFNGSCLFLKVEGQEFNPVNVHIVPIQAPNCANWKVATSLPVLESDAQGFGLFCAKNYDELIDHPVEIGVHESGHFCVSEVPHSMIFNGGKVRDMSRICRDVDAICSQHVSMMGCIPMPSYLFLVQLTASGYGGLEHRNSTSLIAARDSLPIAGDENMSDEYCSFLGLCSHEYFHSWNVKRIRPAVLQQADLSVEVYTELLWAFEGITSYYDDLALLRSSVIPVQSYLQLLAQTITRLFRGSGRHKQTIAASSFNAWTRFYKQDENAPNAIVSYYTKGALAALGLDLLIRRHTNDKESLDTLMRCLWQQYGEPDIGVPERGIDILVDEICGCDCSAFFARYVRGVDELPLEDWLAELGIGFRLRPAIGSKDKGSVIKSPEDFRTPLSIGIGYKQQGDFVLLQQVADTSSAQLAGLAVGDRLVAIDGLRATKALIDSGFAGSKAGDVIAVLAFRDDILMTFNVTLQPAPCDTCDLWLMEGELLSDAQKSRRDAWSAGY